MRHAHPDLPAHSNDNDTRHVTHEHVCEWFEQHVLVPLALLTFWVALISSIVEFWSR
jgi:hypothetical protein